MKFLYYLLASVFLVVVAEGLENLQDSYFLTEWSNFKQKFAKHYTSAEEEQKRFDIFKQNLKEILEHNEQYKNGLSTYKMGINQFTDMSKKEFEDFLNKPKGLQSESQNNKRRSLKSSQPSSDAPLPDSFDWRDMGYVSPVEDQGQMGSSWIYSVTGSIESCYAVKSHKLIPLSKTYLSDCLRDCNDNENAFSIIITNEGMPSIETYPNNTNGTCEYKPSQNIFNLRSYGIIPAGALVAENLLKESVFYFGPVSVGVDASEFQLYSGGVFDDPSCSQIIDHDVVVVGYGIDNSTGTAEDYWIIKNSWGVHWGENGYIRLARNKNNMCGVTNRAVYPIFNIH